MGIYHSYYGYLGLFLHEHFGRIKWLFVVGINWTSHVIQKQLLFGQTFEMSRQFSSSHSDI